MQSFQTTTEEDNAQGGKFLSIRYINPIENRPRLFLTAVEMKLELRLEKSVKHTV